MTLRAYDVEWSRDGGTVQAVADHLDVGEDWEVQQSRQGLMWSVYRSGFHDEAQARTYARVAADADPEYVFRVVHVLRVRTETTHMEVVVPPTAQMQPVEQP